MKTFSMILLAAILVVPGAGAEPCGKGDPCSKNIGYG